MQHPYYEESTNLATAMALAYIDKRQGKVKKSLRKVPALTVFCTGIDGVGVIEAFEEMLPNKGAENQELSVKQGPNEYTIFSNALCMLFTHEQLVLPQDAARKALFYGNTIDENFKAEWLFKIVSYVASFSSNSTEEARLLEAMFYNAHYSEAYRSTKPNAAQYNAMLADIEKFWQCFEITLLEFGYKV